MKTYILILSQTFPKGHPEEKKPTRFGASVIQQVKIHTIRENYGNWEKKMKEMDDDRHSLTTQLIATVLGSIAMMVAGAIILPKLESNPWARWIVAGAMMATVAVANTFLFVKAAEFMDRYKDIGGTGLAKVAIILSPIMVAGMVYTAINPRGWSGLGNKIWGNIKKAFEPVGLLTGQVTNGIMGLFNNK